jgi:hypothetical protein
MKIIVIPLLLYWYIFQLKIFFYYYFRIIKSIFSKHTRKTYNYIILQKHNKIILVNAF